MLAIALETVHDSVLTLLVSVLGVVLLWVSNNVKEWLSAKAEKAKADAKNAWAEGDDRLISSLRAYIHTEASNIAAERFPQLAERIRSGEITNPRQVKDVLSSWGSELYDRAIDVFRTRGIDVLETVDEDYIHAMIDWAANSVGPFPGRETAVAILKEGVADQIVNRGIQWVRNRMENINPTE